MNCNWVSFYELWDQFSIYMCLVKPCWMSRVWLNAVWVWTVPVLHNWKAFILQNMGEENIWPCRRKGAVAPGIFLWQYMCLLKPYLYKWDGQRKTLQAGDSEDAVARDRKWSCDCLRSPCPRTPAHPGHTPRQGKRESVGSWAANDT